MGRRVDRHLSRGDHARLGRAAAADRRAPLDEVDGRPLERDGDAIVLAPYPHLWIRGP
jgi:hypothetical protein